MRKHLANAITCLNVLAGSVAVVFALEGRYTLAACCIALAAVFDFLDGFTARLLKAVSAMGKELDSLCDMVSFGLAPALVAFHYMQQLGGPWCWVALLMAAFSALRLAKFNLDERQTSSFIGLATPANAIFWVFGIAGLSEAGVYTPPVWCLALLCLFSCWMLVSPLPMFSLKFKNLRFQDNAIRYIFLLGCIALVLRLTWLGVALCIVWYTLLCLLNLITVKSKRS